MNDIELADAAFELLDTNLWDWDESMNTWCELHGHEAYASIFVRDWRVAGALMEKCVDKPDWMEVHIDRKCSSEATHRCWIERTHSGIEHETYHARNESLPRAIIEAYVEALT